ncbi:DUF1905 domain-containing protein [Streptomyces sp. NPDC004279]
MELVFAGPVIEWRGPSPYYFVTVPAAESADIREVAAMATYGWGVIPVEARIGAFYVTTATGAPLPGEEAASVARALEETLRA